MSENIEDSIPLEEGEPSASVVVERSLKPIEHETMRGHRADPRRTNEGMTVCFSPRTLTGKTEYVECPMLDLSPSGIGILFDSALKTGQIGMVCYPTFGFHPVRVEAAVVRCKAHGEKLFHLSLRFARRLTRSELRTAKPSPGRELVPGIRPRKLIVPDEPPQSFELGGSI